MSDLSDRLLAVRDPDEAKKLVAEAEEWLDEHPRDFEVLTAIEQAQRMASIGSAEPRGFDAANCKPGAHEPAEPSEWLRGLARHAAAAQLAIPEPREEDR